MIVESTKDRAEQMLAEGKADKVLPFIRGMIKSTEALYSASNFTEKVRLDEVAKLKEIETQFRERIDLRATAKPAATAPPSHPIERHIEAIQSDWRFSPEQKARQTAGLRQVLDKEKEKERAAQELAAKYESPEYQQALRDADFLIEKADASDLPDDFKQSMRDNRQRLTDTANVDNYHADRTVFLARQSEFRKAAGEEFVKRESERLKAERDAAMSAAT